MKNNQKPLISVIMPMYNAEKYIFPAVESIIAQTYKNWEMVILDDGSNDKSFKIVSELAKKDKRIKLYKNSKNLGIGVTVNKLLKLVKGDYIARMDADDIAFPQRLEKELSFLMSNPKVGIVGSYMIEINEENEPIDIRKVPLKHNEITKQFMTMQAIQNPTMMLNKKLISPKDLWHNSNLSPVDDLDFYLRVVNKVVFANTPHFLMAYRKHSSNSSLKNIKRTFALSLWVRINAFLNYGYRISFDQIAVSFMQAICVFLLPQSLLYSVFKFWKKGKQKQAKIVFTNQIFATSRA